MKALHLWNFIHHNLSNNSTVILVAVVNHEEGSPGKEGFKMAVSSNGDSVGSIGGGVMEYDIMKKTGELLKSNTFVRKLEKLYHNKKSSVKKSGLICAGSQTNFTMSFNKDDIQKIESISNFFKEHKPGKIIFSQDGLAFESVESKSRPSAFYYKDENDWRYEEAIGASNVVYVIGGGHVGLAVCRIMSMLEFHVVVYDDRMELATMKENNYANKKIIALYKDLGKYITPGNNNFVVIVTTGYESDKESLRQVIGKDIRYIGLMGTKVKIKKIFNDLVKVGVDKAQLKTIHAPIGIDINSDTPEEIAVSICAEIVMEKNK